MSYKEKSIWISLVATILLFGIYFTLAFLVFKNPGEPTDTNLLGLFIVVIIVYIAIQIVLQSALAIRHRKEANYDDERDKLIELKATRISYFILVAGAWSAGIWAFLLPSPAITANIIMFCFILSETIAYTAQLIYYRKGV